VSGRNQTGWGTRILRFPLVRIVLAAVPIVLAISSVQPLLARHWRDGFSGVCAKLLLNVLILALYAGYVRLIERRPPRELGGGVVLTAGEVGLGLALGMALFTTAIGVLWALGTCTVEPGEGWSVAGVALVASLSAAVAEEVLLRAIFFRILEEGLGTWIALGLSAALFGALHASNPGATVVSSAAIALEAGVLLAAAYMLRDRLWLPIGLHTGWNFTEGGLFGASVSGNTAHGLYRTTLHGSPLLTGAAFGPEASLIAVVLCLTAGVAMLWASNRRGRFVSPSWRRQSSVDEIAQGHGDGSPGNAR
jgi:membrane protease YdiL (CAAX protease family)